MITWPSRSGRQNCWRACAWCCAGPMRSPLANRIRAFRRWNPAGPDHQHRAALDEAKVELTPLEFRLLHCLMRNPGRIMTHDQIISNVWGYDYDGYSNQIAVYVRRVRMKIESDPDNPRYVLTVRGLGYKFALD